MSDSHKNRILLFTRGFIHLIEVLLACLAVILLIVAVVMPFYWPNAVYELAHAKPGIDAAALYPWLYGIFAFGIVTIALIWTILRKLNAIVASVAKGDPFILANAVRLKAVGWLMIAVQIIGIPLTFCASNAADLIGKNNVDYDFSFNAILSILLVFILAGIFEQGARMREELEGTI